MWVLFDTQSEWSLMNGLLPDKHLRKIYDMLVQTGIDSVIREGEVRYMTC